MIEKEVPLDEIKVLSDRTRTSKEKKTDMDLLVDSIKKLGLFHPILINEDYELVAGFRRLTAYKILRQEEPVRYNTIRVRILPAADEYKQLEAEIHENWARKELKGYELDTALARLKRLYQKLHPETIQGVAGGKASGIIRSKKRTTGETAVVPRFEEFMADDLMQKSVSTIEKRVRVGEAIEEKVFTEPEVEAYKEGEVTHTKMLKTYEKRKKLKEQLEESLEKEAGKNEEVNIFSHLVKDSIPLTEEEKINLEEQYGKAEEEQREPKIKPDAPNVAWDIPQPEEYECILSVNYGVRQKIEGLTIKEVREWYITILTSDKLWEEIGEPDEFMIGVVSLSEKDRVLGLDEDDDL